MLELLKGLPLAFFSAAFYRKAVREWSGIGAGFILIVTAFSLIVSNISMYTHMKGHGGIKMEQLLAKLPEAAVKDKKLSIDAPSPYVVNLFDTKVDNVPNNLVIDTDFTSTDDAAIRDYMEKHDAFFLITATKLIFEDKDGTVNAQDLPAMHDRRFTQEDYHNYGRIIDTWSYPISAAVIAVSVLIINFIVAAIGGGIAILLGLVAGLKLDYPAALRLAACAAVPATVIVVPLQWSFGIKCLIWFGYSIFGVLALRQQPKPAGS